MQLVYEYEETYNLYLYKTNSICSDAELLEYKSSGIGSSINLIASCKLAIAFSLVLPNEETKLSSGQVAESACAKAIAL